MPSFGQTMDGELANADSTFRIFADSASGLMKMCVLIRFHQASWGRVATNANCRFRSRMIRK